MDAPRFALSRADYHHAPTVIVLTYSFERVQNEIHQGLNELGLVADYGRDRSWQIEAHSDPFECGFGPDNTTDVMQNLSKINRRHLDSNALKDRSNILHGVDRSRIVPDDVLDRDLHLFKSGFFGVEQAKHGLRVAPDCAEWLI